MNLNNSADVMHFAPYPMHQKPIAITYDSTHNQHVIFGSPDSSDEIIMCYDGPTFEQDEMR